MLSKIKIAVYGLGYVGLPLAIKFGEKFKTIGFDIDPDRINNLKNYIDKNAEITEEELKDVDRDENVHQILEKL